MTPEINGTPAQDTPGPVVERQAADNCFETAQDQAKRVRQNADPNVSPDMIALIDAVTTALQHATLAQVWALEGVARQVRDMDNALWHSADATRKAVAEAITTAAQSTKQGLDDLGAMVNAIELIVPTKGSGRMFGD